MSRFIYLIIVILLTQPYTMANEEVVLITDEVNTIKLPEAHNIILNKEKELKDTLSKKDELPAYLEFEDEVFSNKAGQVFSKFINNTAINNKINRTYSQIEAQYLD